MDRPANSIDLCQQMAAAHNGVCLLSFSCGKDSIAAWLQLREHFDRIIPVYMYLVPGLEFIDRSLAYYEQVFQAEIIRLPHPSLYRWLNHLTFQPPEHCRIIEDAGLPSFDYDDVLTVAKEIAGVSQDTYTAVGVRSADSINRHSAIKQHGPYNMARKQFYPVYDWKKEQLVDTIARSSIKLPPEYRLFGRSFDGLDYRFLKPIKEHFSADYDRILAWFPLADIELARMTYRSNYYGRT